MSSSIDPDRDAPERWSKVLAKGDPLRSALRDARQQRAPQPRLDRVFASVVALTPGAGGGGELAGPDVDAAGSGAVATSGAHAIGKAAVVGKVAGASAVTASTALVKLVVVGALGAASVGTAWWIGADAVPAATTPPTKVATFVPPVRTVAPVEERPRTLADAAPSAASSATAPSTSNAAASALAAEDRSEATLLREASAAVSSDPDRAMRLVDEAERRFAGGALGQERELIRVQALIAAGRRDEAISRARKLLERNPSSAHRPRLEKMLPELAN